MRTDEGLLAALEEHVDPILKHMLATIADTRPAYRSFETEEEDRQWAIGVQRLLQLFVEIARHERPLTPGETQDIERIGELRATQGFELMDVTKSVRAAVEVVGTWTLKLYDPQRDEWKALSKLHTHLLRYGNIVEDLIVEGFCRRIRDRATEAGPTLIGELIEGRISDAEELSEQADAAGLGFLTTASLVVIAEPRKAVVMTRRLKEEGVRCEWTERGSPRPHAALLLAFDSPDQWDGLFELIDGLAGALCTTVVVDIACNPLDLHHRHPDIARLTSCLPQLPGGALRATELLVARVAAALPEDVRRNLLRETLGGLDALAEKKARQMDELFEQHVRFGFAAPDIARAVGINEKTVLERRKPFTAATGLRMERGGDELPLTLAYYAKLTSA